MDNKVVYESLFQNDETFRRNFPSQNDFETYVSQEGKLDEIKDLYDYQEPIETPDGDPVKKKEGGSPFRSLFRYFGGGDKPKVELGQLTDPFEESVSSLNAFKDKREQFLSTRSELSIQDLPFKVLSSPVSMFSDIDAEGDYTENPQLLTLRDELSSLQPAADNAADFLINAKYGNPFITSTEMNEEGVQEVVDKQITDEGLALAKELSTEKPDLVSADLGFEEEYSMVVDMGKVRQKAGEIYHESFPEESVSDMESDPRFQKIQQRLQYTASEILSINTINNEISKSLREYFPDNVDIQKDGYKAIKNISNTLSNDLWRTTKEIEIDASEVIGSQIESYKKIEQEVSTDIKAKLDEFKQTHGYDEVTNQYLVTPDQQGQFEVDAMSLQRYTEDAISSLSTLKIETTNKINDLSADYQKKIKDARDQVVQKYKSTSGVGEYKNYDPEKIKMALDDAIGNYKSKSAAMEAASYMVGGNLTNVAQAFMQGTGSLMRGVSDIMDIYLSPFGSSGLGVSTAIKGFGEDLLKYDYKYFNPTYEMAGTDPWLLTKKAIFDFARMGPTLIPTIASAVAGLPVQATALISFVTDSAMEVDEAKKQVYEETGDILLAERAAEDKLNDQWKILPTYYADAALLTPKKFFRINNLGKAFVVNTAKLGLNYGEELLQEGFQNASTKGIIDRYVKNIDSDYSVLDEMMDPELMKSVAGMTLISQGITSSIDTYSQLKGERIVTKVNELFNNKGMANLLNRANKVNKNAIAGFYEMQYMMGNLTLDQLKDAKKAISREAQFASSSNIIAPNANEEKQAAIIGLLQEKDDLEAKIEGIENQTAKDIINKKIKELDKTIETISQSEGLEGFTTIKIKSTGQVIVSLKDESLKDLFANNPNANAIVNGVMSDVLEVNTSDKTVSDIIEYTKVLESDKQQFAKDLNNLAERQRQERAKRADAVKRGETPSLTEDELNEKFKEEFINLIKERDKRVSDIKKDGSRIEEEIDRYKKQNEDSSISGVAFDPIFNVDENTNFDDIKLTFNNPKISAIVDQVKEYLPALKDIYGNAKVTFVKSNAEMSALGYKNSDGLFDPGTNTVFINLESADEYTFFHEFTHAALIKAFGEDTAVLFDSFVKDIEKALGPETSKRLKAFVSNYSENMRPEEYLAQLGAFMGIEQNKLNVGTVTKIKALIYDVLNKMGLKKLATYFNSSYDQKKLFDMFNSIGKAYRTKDVSEYLKFANDVFKSRVEKNAHLRGKNPKVNKGSVEFSEGILAELSKEFGISQEESDAFGIRYDKEKNTIIANNSGVISTDQYFSVIADVLLHNYIKNNTEGFLKIADTVDRAMYKKLRGLYEKNQDINDISSRASRSFYTYLANGSQIKNMESLWDSLSEYYVGTKVNRLAGLYTLGSRYFNKRTESNVGINQLSDEKLKELSKLAKGTSIYNVIDMHKNGYDFFTISNRVRQSINRSRIVDSIVEAFTYGQKFPEYEIEPSYYGDLGINLVDKKIIIPEEITDDESIRLMYNVALLDIQRSNTVLFLNLLKAASKISGYSEELEGYREQYINDVEKGIEPDETKARFLFDKMVDAFVMRTDEILDDISSDEVSRLENEVFNEYRDPLEIPLIEKKQKIDYIIYKILDPNSPFFSDVRYQNIVENDKTNSEAISRIADLVNSGKAEVKIVESSIGSTGYAVELSSENLNKLEEKINDLVPFEDESFYKAAQDIYTRYNQEDDYLVDITIPINSRFQEAFDIKNKPNAKRFIFERPEYLYSRELFQELFGNDPEKMRQYDDMLEFLKGMESEMYDFLLADRMFKLSSAVYEDNVVVSRVFNNRGIKKFEIDDLINDIDREYKNVIEETSMETSLDPRSIVLKLRDDMLSSLSMDPNDTEQVLTAQSKTDDGLIISFKDPRTNNVIDETKVSFHYFFKNKEVIVNFSSNRYGFMDTPRSENRLNIPSNVVKTVLSSLSNLPVNSVTFTAADSTNKKYAQNAEKFRTDLYSTIGKRLLGDFYYGKGDFKEGKNIFTISLPPFINVGRSLDSLFDPDATFSPNMEERSSRVRESRSRAHKNINDFVESEKAKGTPASDIYNRAYVLFGDEYLRTSKYGSEYQTERDKFQMNAAIDGMNRFSNEFEKRRQGIVNFIDKYRDKASLLKLVNLLRNGVNFIDEETGLIAIEAPINTTDIVDPNLAQPVNVPGATKVKFSDYEIFLALSAIGETSEDLGKIFGNEYRQTIENAIQKGQFSTNILSELSKDAQSKRITRRIEDLSMLGQVFNDIDPKSVIDYIVSNLDTLGIEPAFQNLLERIKDAKTFQEMNGQIALSISDIRQTQGDLESVSQLASFAGRILRLMRQISDDPSEIIMENIRKRGRTIPTGIENDIKNKVANKSEKNEAHKKALLNAWADPSDENISLLINAEKDLDDASWDLARLLNSEAVQGRYWSDVLQKHGAFALLSLNTVFLSAASVLELLYRQQFAPISNYAAYLADKKTYITGDIEGYKVRSRNSPFNKSFWRNSSLAHQYAFDKNMYQMARSVLTGQTGTSGNLYYDLPAQANALRDASNFFNALLLYAKKSKNKETLTDEDLAEVLERSLIEVDGKKVLPGGRSYQMMAAAFRGLNPGYLQSELTARLMPLGLDQLGVNTLMMDSMLDYSSFQMAADYRGIPKGIIGTLMERSPDVSLRNAALLTQSLVAAGYIKTDVIEQEALRSTFFNTNSLTSRMSDWRSSVRKKMNQKDAIITEELKKGDQRSNVKLLAQYTSLHYNQVKNLLTYAAVPFLRVPSNIAFMLIKRANPLGASINAVVNYNKYKNALNEIQAKYQKQMGMDITLYQEPTKSVDIPDSFTVVEKDLKKKAAIEKEMMDLYGAKRKYTEAVGDIMFSSTLVGTAATIAMSGALTPSDDPEKRGALQEVGLEFNELNISMLKEYLLAGGSMMTDEERKKWKASRKIKSDDLKINLINLGTYFGYSLGFAADIYKQYESTQSDKNGMLWDSLQKHFTTGDVLGTMSRTVFKMTPSAQFLEEVIKLATEKSKDGGPSVSDKIDNLLANLAATSGASFAPSIFGKPLSVSEGIKAQSTREIDLDRETANFPLDIKFIMMAHMRMSRNGIILPGMWRSEFYKAKIGLFGEDLTIRKTLSEPGTTASYIESTLNFFKLRRDPRVMPKNIKDETRLNREIEKHNDINEVATGVLSMAQAYARLGGDPSSFYKMFNKPLKNKFIVTEYGSNEEGVDMDIPITLPNDIFRAEARMLGEYKYALVGQIRDMINTTMALSPDGKENYTEEDMIAFKEQLPRTMAEINALLDAAEKDYQGDFISNRADIVVREMYNRGILSNSDYNKLLEKGFDENIIKAKDATKWGLDLYQINSINFADTGYYNPDLIE